MDKVQALKRPLARLAGRFQITEVIVSERIEMLRVTIAETKD